MDKDFEIHFPSRLWLLVQHVKIKHKSTLITLNFKLSVGLFEDFSELRKSYQWPNMYGRTSRFSRIRIIPLLISALLPVSFYEFLYLIFSHTNTDCPVHLSVCSVYCFFWFKCLHLTHFACISKVSFLSSHLPPALSFPLSCCKIFLQVLTKTENVWVSAPLYG